MYKEGYQIILITKQPGHRRAGLNGGVSGDSYCPCCEVWGVQTPVFPTVPVPPL